MLLWWVQPHGQNHGDKSWLMFKYVFLFRNFK